jgi:hypothetical protein
MNHQPFETWILENTRLKPENQRILADHLAVCPGCAHMHRNWAVLQNQLSSTVFAQPKPGFTQRWAAYLQNRRAEVTNQQTRKLMLIIVIMLILTLGSSISVLLVSTSPVSIFTGLVALITRTVITINDAVQIALSLVRVMPPIIPISLWVLFFSAISVLSLIWAIALWKFSTKGALTQ